MIYPVISENKGVVHGAIFGVLSLVIVAVTQYIFGGMGDLIQTTQQNWILWISSSVILGALGGLVWDMIQIITKKVKISNSN